MFGELPDMMKQQILEFVGGDGLYVLGYNYKTKSFTQMINKKGFMKKTLEYKINTPPVCIRSNRYNIQYIRYTPPKIHDYLFVCYDYRTGVENRLVINPKYRVLITKINKKYNPEYNSYSSVRHVTIPGVGKYMLL
jgi:hypothetical protein